MRVLREPLVHFFVAGGLLFALYGAPDNTQNDDHIVVGTQDIALLSAQWQQQLGRKPTSIQLQSAIKQHVRDEMLYREALAQGLEKHDVIVRRRLIQKMEFLATDIAMSVPPKKNEIDRYFKTNKANYSEPSRLTFSHIYFSPDIRGLHNNTDAVKALLTLQSSSDPLLADQLGDPFILQLDTTRQTPESLDTGFGKGFSGQLKKLSVGEWHGPLTSSYGLHLVRMTDHQPPYDPDFETVRQRVEMDWLDQHKREVKQRRFEQLEKRYRVEVADHPFLENSG